MRRIRYVACAQCCLCRAGFLSCSGQDEASPASETAPSSGRRGRSRRVLASDPPAADAADASAAQDAAKAAKEAKDAASEAVKAQRAKQAEDEQWAKTLVNRAELDAGAKALEALTARVPALGLRLLLHGTTAAEAAPAAPPQVKSLFWTH